MKHEQETITRILEKHVPRVSDEQADAVSERVLYRLHHSKPAAIATRADAEPVTEPPLAGRRVRRWPALGFAIAAVLVLSIAGFSFVRELALRAGKPHSTVKVIEGPGGVRQGNSETLPSQTPPPSLPEKKKTSFEVVSIRPDTTGWAFGGVFPVGDRLKATRATLRNLLWYAFQPGAEQFQSSQILGVPGWGDTEKFDVEAKIGAESTTVPKEQIQEMAQAMLEDRFQLKAHRAVREFPVYNLVIVKNGPKLSADQTPTPMIQRYIYFGSDDSPLPRGAVRVFESPYQTRLVGQAVDTATIMNLLQGRADRLVLNKTNFTGLFDLDIQIAKDSGPLPPPDMALPTVFGALQELNLKLEAQKENLPVVIVDSVQHPTPN
jgi:uncharacterized protein (TIGR03435 family)